MSSAATASGRKTQKAGAPTPAPAIFVSNDSREDTLDLYRVQRLIACVGVSAKTARVIAPFAFGGAA